MRVSQKQLDEFTSCERKWFFARVARLPTIRGSRGIAGTVLHGVIERILRAKDTEAVDPYPAGWHVAVDHFGNVEGEADPLEQETIRAVVKAAQEQGVLHPVPGRLIEHGFAFTATTQKGRPVEFTGFMDLFIPPDVVVDHKSTAKRRNIKSPRKVAETTQMRLYGVAAQEAAGWALEAVTAKHIYYVLDPAAPFVKPVSVPLSRDLLRASKDVFLAAVDNMADRKLAAPEEWPSVPKTAKDVWDCRYCPYVGVCTGAEKMEQYKSRLSGGLDSSGKAVILPTVPPATSTQGGSMSFFDKIKSAAAPAPVAPPPAAITTVPPPAPPVQPKVDSAQMPPWAFAAFQAKGTCPACLSSGLNTKGNPCQICDMAAPKGSKSSDYDLRVEGGRLLWAAKGTLQAPLVASAAAINAAPAEHAGSAPLPAVATPTVAPEKVAEPEDEDGFAAMQAAQAEDDMEAVRAEMKAVAAAKQAALDEAVARQNLANIKADQARALATLQGQAVGALPPAVQAALAAQGVSAAPPTPAPAEKRGRGRPKGAKNKATLEKEAAALGITVEEYKATLAAQAAEEPAPQAAPAPAGPEPVPAPQAAPAGVRPALPDFMLLVNCALTSRPSAEVVQGHEILAGAREALKGREFKSVWDEREAVRLLIDNGGAGPEALHGKYVVLRTDDPNMSNLLAALRPWASSVVEGLR